MVAVPAGKIEARRFTPATTADTNEFVCGTCGAKVAREHVTVHANWHNTAGWVQTAINTTGVTGQPGGS